MSGEPTGVGGGGLLRGGRSRSYGSLVRSPVAPARRRLVEHRIQPGETLQGLALKYGVSMEQIKRVNRLYTNDSIFLKKSLSIPVLADKTLPGVVDNDGGGEAIDSFTEGSADEQREDGAEMASDVTPKDFFKRLDELISQSKKAAVKRCQEGEERVAELEAACTDRMPGQSPFTRVHSTASGLTLSAPPVPIPVTITRLTKKLRDREDEIFQL